MNVLSQGNLEVLLANLKRLAKQQLTKEPMTAPKLKIIQNHEIYRPLLASGGYDIMRAP